MNVEDKMHNEQIYFCDDVIVEQQSQCLELLYDFNYTRPKEIKRRQEILGKYSSGCLYR